MVKEIGIQQVNEAVTFSWNLCQRRDQSKFPHYESSEALHKAFMKTVKHPDDRLLVYEENHKWLGLLNLFVEKKEKYLQANGFYIKDDYDRVGLSMMEYLKENYVGYQMFFGYAKENINAVRFMELIGAECVESSLTMRLDKDKFTRSENTATLSVLPVTRETFNDFALFHDRHQPEVYWTSQRILEKFDQWQIYAITEKGCLVGSIHIALWHKDEAEIFGVSVETSLEREAYAYALLAKSMPDVFARGKRSILYFVEEDKAWEKAAALKIGFTTTDHYLGYRVNL